MIGWGSTYNPIKEALEELRREDLAFLHFKQIYPLSEDVLQYFQSAEKLIVIENNATSQFGKLLKLKMGVDIHEKILKYSGLAFSVEEIVAGIKKILG